MLWLCSFSQVWVNGPIWPRSQLQGHGPGGVRKAKKQMPRHSCWPKPTLATHEMLHIKDRSQSHLHCQVISLTLLTQPSLTPWTSSSLMLSLWVWGSWTLFLPPKQPVSNIPGLSVLTYFFFVPGPVFLVGSPPLISPTHEPQLSSICIIYLMYHHHHLLHRNHFQYGTALHTKWISKGEETEWEIYIHTHTLFQVLWGTVVYSNFWSF